MSKKILKLTLTIEWFDLIATGKKPFEYREYKDHWISRMFEMKPTSKQRGCFHNFDEIHFTNGYGKHRPWMRVEFKGSGILASKDSEPKNGEILKPNKNYFVLGLGKVLETRNYTPPL